MENNCSLRETLGIEDEPCEGPDCIYWRALGHLGVSVKDGCAVEHSDVLDDPELLKWLLTVKERLDGTKPPGGAGSAG